MGKRFCAVVWSGLGSFHQQHPEKSAYDLRVRTICALYVSREDARKPKQWFTMWLKYMLGRSGQRILAMEIANIITRMVGLYFKRISVQNVI